MLQATTTLEAMSKMGVIGARFGDEQSTLLDEFERLSFEAHAAQLNRVMLGRSLSEPRLLPKSHSRLITIAPIPLVMQQHGHGGGGGGECGSGFHKVLKKLLKPFLGGKRRGRKQVSQAKDLMSCKVFSRSLRF
ncbi:hypothetical protein RJT34_17766 [Clitoria ternatea]|uniref:Uncharacterized protein n=1 Tax=Clitoria ternatea TaxID=43366 RepID=A0AAN9JAT8_CLITE